MGAAARHSICPPPPPRLLDEETAAAYLGRSKSLFRSQWGKGDAPAPIRQGGRLYWDRKLLDSYVDALSGIAPVSDTWGDYQ